MKKFDVDFLTCTAFEFYCDLYVRLVDSYRSSLKNNNSLSLMDLLVDIGFYRCQIAGAVNANEGRITEEEYNFLFDKSFDLKMRVFKSIKSLDKRPRNMV